MWVYRCLPMIATPDSYVLYLMFLNEVSCRIAYIIVCLRLLAWFFFFALVFGIVHAMYFRCFSCWLVCLGYRVPCLVVLGVKLVG